MSAKRSRDSDLLHDVASRQRNTVFPDTLMNEARGWASLISSKRKLSLLQFAGVTVMGVVLLVAFVGYISLDLRGWDGSGVLSEVCFR